MWDTTSRNQIITIFDLKGFSSNLTLRHKLVDELRIRKKYENFFFVLVKIFLKTLLYYFTKIFLKRKYIKYN